jgi:hypothetical protein
MNTENLNQPVETKTNNDVATTIVDFLTDCGLEDADVHGYHLFLAFEFAYKPLPRFWRDFDMAALFKTISERFPDWPAAVQKRGLSVSEVFIEAEEVLRSNAFDEANAEMMMVLPRHTRPTERQAAADWICIELRRRKRKSELRLAEQLGKHCGEGALQELNCLECIADGTPFERLGTQVARYWRNQRLNERQKVCDNA